jgi:hypothetical protein
MKKIMAIILCVLLVLSLTACTWNESSTDTSKSDGRMKMIFNDGFAIIYVDTETGVQYFSRSNCGTCVMVDENGNPVIYSDLEAIE